MNDESADPGTPRQVGMLDERYGHGFHLECPGPSSVLKHVACRPVFVFDLLVAGAPKSSGGSSTPLTSTFASTQRRDLHVRSKSVDDAERPVCARCEQHVKRTEILPDAYAVAEHYNRPCGCKNAGLIFDFGRRGVTDG
jgi:hypothetical protein